MLICVIYRIQLYKWTVRGQAAYRMARIINILIKTAVSGFIMEEVNRIVTVRLAMIKKKPYVSTLKIDNRGRSLVSRTWAESFRTAFLFLRMCCVLYS